MPWPRGNTPLTTWRRKPWGFRLGCGASARSSRRVGDDRITSPKGFAGDGRRKPPVPHLRRLSCTLPSRGLRKTSQGSHIDLGITLTPLNSAWAPFGRSPPRLVVTSRTISPRRSSPACASDAATKYDISGLAATTTFAPGTSTGISARVHCPKNQANRSKSARERTVKRGSGDLRAPSKEGGRRHTPPFCLRNLLCSFAEYSTSPYGGSVTTA